MFPLSLATCSLYELAENITHIQAHPEIDIMTTQVVDQLISPFAGCGTIFGPELLFAHVLQHEHIPFSIIKVVGKGSTIYKHWGSPTNTVDKPLGWYWKSLVERIQTIDAKEAKWRGIVWSQGENELFKYGGDSSYELYLGNLTNFIADVRQELYTANLDQSVNSDDDGAAFATPSDIPVVIVGAGCWIQGLRGRDFAMNGTELLRAQNDFVNRDANAAFVDTGDLSCHYHFDFPSQLLIGYRVALAFKSLLGIPEPPRDYC